MITESITPAPQLFGPRSNPIRIILIHATRGGTASSAIDYSATKNWFRSSNNNAGGTWGGCASSIIGPNGELCRVLNDDQIPHYSAGYGGLGPPTEYLLDDYAKSYELAQPNNDVAYTDLQYERLAIEVAIDCKAYNIPAVMIDLRSQRYPVPTGIGRHDRSANGVKLGKSDPGKMFDEARFIALLNQKLHMEDDWMANLTDAQTAELAYFLTPHDWGNGTDIGGIPWFGRKAISPMRMMEIVLSYLDSIHLGNIYRALGIQADGSIVPLPVTIDYAVLAKAIGPLDVAKLIAEIKKLKVAGSFT